MIEIDVTDFVNNEDPSKYSASMAELGPNASTITWENSLECSHPLLNAEEERQAFRDYLAPFGAWDEEEIAAWNNVELNALFIQFVSAAMREGSETDLFKGEDGKTYYGLYH